MVIARLHTDHADELGYFRDAEIVIWREEWSAPGEIRGRGRGYLPQFFARWLRPRTVELRGHPVGPFPASYPLTNAGDVLLVPTCVHTFGHLSVIVNQPGGSRLVLAGDASYRQDLMLDGVVDGVAADERAAGNPWAGCNAMSASSRRCTCPPTTRGSNERFSANEIVPA